LKTPKKTLKSDFLPQKYLVTSQKDFKNIGKALDVPNHKKFKNLKFGKKSLMKQKYKK
jgi:hypothetical protein